MDSPKRRKLDHDRTSGHMGKSFICEFCSRGFLLESHFRNHMKMHTNSNSFVCDKTAFNKASNHFHVCDICGKVFIRKGNLARHKCVHTNDKTHVCDICGMAFLHRHHLKDHGAVHSKIKPFVCNFCGKKFSRKRSVKQHIGRVHANEKPHGCHICDKAFLQEHHLTDHLTCHGDRKAFDKSDDLLQQRKLHEGQTTPTTSSKTHSEDPKFKCDIREKVYTSKTFLVAHTHHRVCNHVSNERKHACHTCGKAFKHKYALIRHSRIHTNERPHVCDICGKAFLRKHHLKDHVSSVHNQLKQFVCDFCSKSFSRRRSVKEHIRRVHDANENDKPHVCHLCGQAFLQQHLKNHLMTFHSDLKPFVCDICGKAFNGASDLLQHLSLHGQTLSNTHSEDPKFNCDICGKIFTRKEGLNRHKRAHLNERPHVCDICGKAFLYKYNLKDHLAVHRIRKPFVCGICSKAFSRRMDVKAHIRRLHTNDNPYVCDFCGKAFDRPSHLSRHRTLHERVPDFSLSQPSGDSETDSVSNMHAQREVSVKQEKQCENHTCNRNCSTKCILVSPQKKGSEGYSVKCEGKAHNRVCTNNRPHVCYICGKAFKHAGALLHHKNILHTKTPCTETKLFKCDICGEDFFWKRHLRSHMKVHPNLRSFLCELCGKAFRTSAYLRHHKRTLHGGNLQAHIPHHTPPSVKQEKQEDYHLFNEECSTSCHPVRNHKTTGSSSDSTFNCDICDKVYKTKNALAEHSRIHINDIQVCDICGRTFTQFKDLLQHKRTLHNKEALTTLMFYVSGNKIICKISPRCTSENV